MLRKARDASDPREQRAHQTWQKYHRLLSELHSRHSEALHRSSTAMRALRWRAHLQGLGFRSTPLTL